MKDLHEKEICLLKDMKEDMKKKEIFPIPGQEDDPVTWIHFLKVGNQINSKKNSQRIFIRSNRSSG